jgi:DMSO/TMAO reductase YedYZ molybdopterin-dependent catalytic subunit
VYRIGTARKTVRSSAPDPPNEEAPRVRKLLTARALCTTLRRMRDMRLSFAISVAGFLLVLPLASHSGPQAPAATAAPATQSAKLEIAGDVPTSITLTAADLAAMPRERAEVTEQDGTKSTYEGVALQEVLKKAGLSFGKQMRGKALAGYVLAEAKDGYQVAFATGELDPDLGGAKVLVADKLNGKALSEYQGPLRLVVPADKEGARSVRMLEKLQVVMLRK